MFLHFPYPQPIDSILGISSNLLGVIATIALGVIAIFGEQIKSFVFRPDLQPDDQPTKTKQRTPILKSDGVTYHEDFTFHRLPIKNIGNATAREVRVLLTYTKTVENFIPIPLNWTHWNKSTRDISCNEPAYLDIIMKREGEYFYEFCWSVDTRTPVESMLKHFRPKLGNIRLEFFERDRKVGDILLKYTEEKDALKVVKITEK